MKKNEPDGEAVKQTVTTAEALRLETEPQNTKEDLELVKGWQTKTWSQSKLVGKSISDLLVTRHEGET